MTIYSFTVIPLFNISMVFDCVYILCLISCISNINACCVDCNAGQFGENCSLSCDCGGSSCDPVTGLAALLGRQARPVRKVALT